MDDLISRADAIRLMKNELYEHGDAAVDAAVLVLREMPSAQNRAEWKFLADSERYACTHCGKTLTLGVDPSCYGIRYCMQCGCLME